MQHTLQLIELEMDSPHSAGERPLHKIDRDRAGEFDLVGAVTYVG
jgi:hypothetical protein